MTVTLTVGNHCDCELGLWLLAGSLYEVQGLQLASHDVPSNILPEQPFILSGQSRSGPAVPDNLSQVQAVQANPRIVRKMPVKFSISQQFQANLGDPANTLQV